MDINQLKPGVQVEHIDKTPGKYSHDGVYGIVNVNARLKNPTTREWHDAVIYVDLENIYIRDKEDFLKEFQIKLQTIKPEESK